MDASPLLQCSNYRRWKDIPPSIWDAAWAFCKSLELRLNAKTNPPIPIHLAAEEIAILEILEREYPMKVTQLDLASGISREVRTIRTHLKNLLQKELIYERTKGDKKGEAITDKGLSLIRERKQ
jgi:predicted transcriptional regulator